MSNISPLSGVSQEPKKMSNLEFMLVKLQAWLKTRRTKMSTISDIQYDKTYTFSLASNMAFGDLSEEEIVEVLSDGRPMSHLIEVQLTKWFPQLTHIRGCKDHDHVMEKDGQVIKLDAKNFTKRGCKFMPSSMIGTGRTFDKGLFNESVKHKDYIICDITRLPKVHVQFKKGTELAASFPKGKITKSQRGLLF